jgi:hypothetical protein
MVEWMIHRLFPSSSEGVSTSRVFDLRTTIHQSIYPKVRNDAVNAKLLKIFLTGCLLVQLSCTESVNDTPIANKPPKTYLWLYPDSAIGVGISRQHLRWWGEDPDGIVRGYLFAFVPARLIQRPNPDTLRYTWVSGNDTLMQFPLDTLFRYFTVFVRAVDNTFEGLPNQTLVRLTPNPFVDSNKDGVFNSGDALLPALTGALDPTGAVQAFPIRNTRPTVAFLPNPNDATIAQRQPDYTYTVATFGFKGSDIDGDNTLSSYRIALNDTTNTANWFTIPLRDTIVTLLVPRARSNAAPPGNGVEVAADVYGGSFLGRRLLGQIPGMRLDAQNVLYVQAKDVAGEFSPAIRMPSATQQWFVKRPRGKLLLVADYVNSDSVAARTTYRASLAAVTGGEFTAVDTINIAKGLTANDKDAGRLSVILPPFIDPALIQTFLLYEYVLWYTDQIPSLGAAQLTLFTYLQNGGKVVFTTTFQATIDPRGALKDFAPIDSISSVPFTPRPAPGDTRVPQNYRVFPDTSDPSSVYPRLAFNTLAVGGFHSVFMRPVYRRSDAKYIYRLQPDTLNNPPRYIGSPNIAVVDGARRIVFVGLPLHLLDNRVAGNPSGLTAFFTKVFTGQFSASQKIDRRKF